MGRRLSGLQPPMINVALTSDLPGHWHVTTALAIVDTRGWWLTPHQCCAPSLLSVCTDVEHRSSTKSRAAEIFNQFYRKWLTQCFFTTRSCTATFVPDLCTRSRDLWRESREAACGQREGARARGCRERVKFLAPHQVRLHNYVLMKCWS